MLARLTLFATLVITWSSAKVYQDHYKYEFTADQQYLKKQKSIYDILFRVTQPELKPDLFKEGNEYSIEANRESYNDKDAVAEFLYRFEHDRLPRDAIFSQYYTDHEGRLRSVFRLLYHAKDFDVFYKTALFCRNRLNPSLFVTAFYDAVLHRPDTKYINLPPIWDLAPEYFFNRELIQKTYRVKEFGIFKPNHSAGYDAYIIPYNHSNYYVTDEYNYEERLNYFTEDISLSNYYYFLRHQLPPYLKMKEFSSSGSHRGERYFYGHKQLITRYYLERLSNDLGTIEDYNYNGPFSVGYGPSIAYSNGLQFPSRPSQSYFPKNKLYKVQKLKDYEIRIGQAVDSGMIITGEGHSKSIMTPEGLSILGNIIEGNADSPNKIYYGSPDSLGRNIIGFGSDPLTPTMLYPSALEHTSTSLRDPGFYRLYKHLLHYYHDYKENQQPYRPEEIQFPELEIASISSDELITFFEEADASIGNGLTASSKQEAEEYVVHARYQRLNHEPFKIYVNINAKKSMPAAIRIFIGPRRNVHNKDHNIPDRYNNFYQLDNFIYNLSAGPNQIVRDSHEFFLIGADPEPSEVYYKQILKAFEGVEQLKYQKRVLGFPERLLLPKGKPEGQHFQLFVHAAATNGDFEFYESSSFGESFRDNRTLGYPLDRLVHHHDFHGPNFLFKDVLIYHKTNVKF